MTTELPAASAGPTLWHTRCSGKLKGLMAATTPQGTLSVNPNRPTPPGAYVIVTRLDSELQDQIANVNRETSQIARLADPDLDSLRTRDLNSEFDPLSETERLSVGEVARGSGVRPDGRRKTRVAGAGVQGASFIG